MNFNKMIHRNKFQHFPFHFLYSSQSSKLFKFSLFSITVCYLYQCRMLFSTNYSCMEKRPLNLNEPLKSNTNSNLSSPESKYFLSNNYKYVDSKHSTTSKFNNADSLNVSYGLNLVKCGFFAIFYLRIKFLFIMLLVGFKKCLSTPIISRLFNIWALPLIRRFKVLGSVYMKK